MTALTLFSGLAVQAPLERTVLPLCLEKYGARVETTFEPTTLLTDRLRRGARPDVLIAVREAVADLAREGLVAEDSVQPLARVGLGVAVAPGTPMPRIDSLPAFIELLVGARSVAYSRAGTSGIYFAQLIDRLGIRDAVEATATVVPQGYTADTLLDGRADLAVQQLSELRSVPGIEIVRPFPAEVQHYTEFAVAITATPVAQEHRELLAALLTLLRGPEAWTAYVDAGLEPLT